MRHPDRCGPMKWKCGRKSYDVVVSAWVDETDLPWDGDEPLDPGMAGFDLTVEVELEFMGQKFVGRDSLGSVWGDRDDIDCELRDSVIPEALANLKNELRAIFNGRDVEAAEKRQRIAGKIC